MCLRKTRGFPTAPSWDGIAIFCCGGRCHVYLCRPRETHLTNGTSYTCSEIAGHAVGSLSYGAIRFFRRGGLVSISPANLLHPIAPLGPPTNIELKQKMRDCSWDLACLVPLPWRVCKDLIIPQTVLALRGFLLVFNRIRFIPQDFPFAGT